MAQILNAIPHRWHIVYSTDACAVTDARRNPCCTVAAGGSSVFWCVGKEVCLSSDSARMYPLSEDFSAVFARVTPGEPMRRLKAPFLTMQHGTWFNNPEHPAVTVRPAEWQDFVVTSFLKTAVPVELSGVTWIDGCPPMIAGYTYVIALQQIDATAVFANLAYTIPQ